MSTLQSLSNHLKHLEDLHRTLDEKITRHYQHHDSDDKVRQEKYEKLSLKREIEELKEQIKELEESEDK